MKRPFYIPPPRLGKPTTRFINPVLYTQESRVALCDLTSGIEHTVRYARRGTSGEETSKAPTPSRFA